MIITKKEAMVDLREDGDRLCEALTDMAMLLKGRQPNLYKVTEALEKHEALAKSLSVKGEGE